ncbi:MAG: T9SS type A sorting domain-containing protein [Candidatus Krumholzibacteria bacterium]|nr:T9SS type A sorting domain-containing protein [Candidatus Krumholzibacteria bacterium]
MKNTSRRIVRAVAVAFVILFFRPVFAINHFYGFSTGIDTTTWEVMFDTSLYTVDDSQGDIHVSKPVGGTHSLQMLHVRFRPIVVGDFDVSVDFRNAQIDRVDGRPGNQIQLNATFGGQSFDVVRSDEIWAGHNYHVWEDPPGEWRGEQPDTMTSGTLRILRIGSVVAGYYRGVIVYMADYNAEDVTFLSFSLQNNGTTDATSVVFDNFRITADALVYPSPLSVGDHPRPTASISVAPNPFVNGTHIEYSLELGGNVQLSVYDAAGRRIAQLASGHRTPGKYVFFWNGGDGRGGRVPSGVYFAKLQIGGYLLTRKMTVIR